MSTPLSFPRIFIFAARPPSSSPFGHVVLHRKACRVGLRAANVGIQLVQNTFYFRQIPPHRYLLHATGLAQGKSTHQKIPRGYSSLPKLTITTKPSHRIPPLPWCLYRLLADLWCWRVHRRPSWEAAPRVPADLCGVSCPGSARCGSFQSSTVRDGHCSELVPFEGRGRHAVRTTGEGEIRRGGPEKRRPAFR